jgi:DNA-binding MarR family transcriptional regulator
MSELALEDCKDVTPAAHDAARGQVVYLTEHGQRLAAIVPAEFAAALESLTPEQIRELFEDLADAADVRAARAAREAGEPVIPWEQAKAEAGL